MSSLQIGGGMVAAIRQGYNVIQADRLWVRPPQIGIYYMAADPAQPAVSFVDDGWVDHLNEGVVKSLLPGKPPPRLAGLP